MRIFFLSLLFLSVAGCGDLLNPPGDSSPLHKSILVEGIEYSADIPTDVFSLYDSLYVVFKVTNTTLLPREFNFANLQQLYFELINRYNQTVLYSPYIVLPALSRFTVGPGETKVLSLSSPFRDHSGTYIDRGSYTLMVFLADGKSPKIDLIIFIN